MIVTTLDKVPADHGVVMVMQNTYCSIVEDTPEPRRRPIQAGTWLEIMWVKDYSESHGPALRVVNRDWVDGRHVMFNDNSAVWVAY